MSGGDLTRASLGRAAGRFDPAAHVALLCDDNRVGWLRKAYAQRLAEWPEIFKRDARGVRLAEALDDPATRTAEIGRVVAQLHAEGTIGGWRDELYAVTTAFDAPPLFHIERAAARFFGTMTYAAHANGYCGGEMWIARRAATKPIDPGMLDNLVGGGMCAGVDPLATIVREAWEEAGVAEAIARKALAAGSFDVLREVPEGVQAETIFVFDLELPHDFVPRNQDGEVAEFRRVAFEKVKQLADGRSMTLDASLVAWNFLERRAL